MSPRTYAGYATTTLNPEPYAYESAYALKRIVERSVREPGTRPWIGWGPYLWTDGTKGRADGFAWTCADVADDGVHPSQSGAAKVAGLLQAFFDGSEFAGWYRGGSAVAAPDVADPVPAAEPPVSGAQIPALVFAGAAAAIAGAATITLRLTRRPA